jgi:hypothetical protein
LQIQNHHRSPVEGAKPACPSILAPQSKAPDLEPDGLRHTQELGEQFSGGHGAYYPQRAAGGERAADGDGQMSGEFCGNSAISGRGGVRRFGLLATADFAPRAGGRAIEVA